MDKKTYHGLLKEARDLETQAKRLGDVARKLKDLDITDENRSGVGWMIETVETVGRIIETSVRHIRNHAVDLEEPTLRAWIIQARNDGRTQGYIAARLGLSQGAISNILKGETLLKDHNVPALKAYR